MTVWGKEAFDLYYSHGAERWGHPNTRPQIILHYHYYPIIRWQTLKHAPRLFNVLGMRAGDSVVLLGAGFNGTGAGLEALGVNVVGTEISDYILKEKDNTEEAEVRAECLLAGVDPDTDLIIGSPGNVMVRPLDVLLEGGMDNPQVRGKGIIISEDMDKRSSRNVIKRMLVNKPRYNISEEVLNSITDVEALELCVLMAKFVAENGGTVVHMLSPLFPGKTQAPELNWKRYAEWRTFLDANGFSAQLILPTVTTWDQGETPLSVDLPDRPNTVVAYSGTF